MIGRAEVCQPPALASGSKFDASSWIRIVDGLSPAELREIATRMSGYAPEAFERALAAISDRRAQ
jgi:hypothetical protein